MQESLYVISAFFCGFVLVLKKKRPPGIFMGVEMMMRRFGVSWCLGILGLLAAACPVGATNAPVMVEKNLFSEDRKPTPPETAAPKPQAAKPGLNPKALQLDGVFIHGDSKRAIVRFKGQMPGSEKGKPTPFATVREGEKIGDYQVLKIEPKRITLEKEGENIVVDLFMEGKVVPPPPPIPGTPGIPNPLAVQGGTPQEAPGGADGKGGRLPRVPRPGAPGGNVAPPGTGDPGAGGPIPGVNPQGMPGFQGNLPDED
ncbi:MAG: hypothetical protein HGA84_07945, partial [Syntrophobacteraceae bacterium]|nr:hypothetical protein [Syntrophobacteraceae bacterium]